MSSGEAQDSLTIFAFSDWRSQCINDLYHILGHLDRDIDLILYAGDDVGRFVDTTKNHFHKLALEADAELGYVLGNDDSPYNLRHFKIETDRVHDLHQNPIRRQRYIFIGQSGDVGTPSMGHIQYSEKECKAHLDQFHADAEGETVVLVSHTPPYGTLDFAQRHNSERIGSKAVRRFSEDVELGFILSGHVHQFGGQTEYTDYGPVVNVASHDHENADSRIALIELPSRESMSNPDDLDVTHTTVKQMAFELDGIDRELSAAAALTKLSQIGPARAETLRNCGIRTINRIASQQRKEFVAGCEFPEYYANIAYDHAQAYVQGQSVIKSYDKFQRIQSQKPILVDIETNLDCNTVWCVGAYSYHDDTFEQFVDLDNEAGLMQRFCDYLHQLQNPKIVYYAGNSFDEKKLTEAAKRHNISLSDVVSDWVDLCLIVREAIFHPSEGHELSTVANALDYDFEYPGISGIAVGAAYSAYESKGEVPEEGWKRYLEYNMDDTLAINHIIDVVADGTPDSANISGNAGSYQVTDRWKDLPTSSEASLEDSDETSNNLDKDVFSSEGSMSYDPYDLMETVSPIVRWTKQEPINNEVESLPQCESCGEVFRDEDEYFEAGEEHFEAGEVMICRGGCEVKRQDGNQNQTENMDSQSATTRNDDSSESNNEQTEYTAKCYECSSRVSKSTATGKYRINDGQTVWYCSSCE